MYLVGYCFFGDVSPVDSEDMKTDFLLELQKLMDVYAVIRLDISIDPYLYERYKRNQYE